MVVTTQKVLTMVIETGRITDGSPQYKSAEGLGNDTKSVNNSMDHSPSPEATSFSAYQPFFRVSTDPTSLAQHRPSLQPDHSDPNPPISFNP